MSLSIAYVKESGGDLALGDHQVDVVASLNASLKGANSCGIKSELSSPPVITSKEAKPVSSSARLKQKRATVVVSNPSFAQLQNDAEVMPGEYRIIDVPNVFVRKSPTQSATVMVRKMCGNKRYTKDIGKFDGHNAFELVNQAKMLIRNLEEGGDSSIITFESGYCRYKDEIQAKSRGVVTHKSREFKIIKGLGPLALSSITSDTILQFLADNTSSNSSYNRYLARLKRIFNVFVQVGLLDKSPAQGLSKRFEEPNPYNAMTEHEVKWFIYFALKDPNFLHKMALLVALTTGLRMGNVISLRKQQIDLNSKTLFVEQAKNGRRLTIPINESAYGLLTMLIDQSSTDYLFPSAKSALGFISHPTECMRRVVQSMKDAGITEKHLVIHSLRHTAASMWYQQTADLAKVCRAMGHSSLHSTLRYAHTDVEAIREMTNKTWYQDVLVENTLSMEVSNHDKK